MINIIQSIYEKALENHARIALGIDRVTPKLLQSAALGRELAVIHSEKPTKTLVDLLVSSDVDGAVRGTLSATSTISYLKQAFGMNKLFRVALLETPDGTPLFLAPVGIDEGATKEEKLEFIR